MNSNNTPSTNTVKRIGELLVESGSVSPEDLEKGLDYGKKTGLPIGRVLVMLRFVSDDTLRVALHIQSLMKFESMPGSLAVKAIILTKTEGLTINEAVSQLGWKSDKLKAGMPQQFRELKDAITETEQRMGKDHPGLATLMLELGAFYEAEDMWPHAEAQVEMAILNLEKAYGRVDLNVANALSRMATLLFLQDRFSEAQPIYHRVVEIRQRLLGAGDPNVGHALFDMAEVFDVQKKWAEAEKHYLQSLKIFETIYQCEEPIIINILKRLSYVYRRRSAPAEPMMIGTMLTESGRVSEEKLPEALAYSKANGVPLARALVHLNYVTEADLRPVLQMQLLIKSNLLPAQLSIRVLRIMSKSGITLEEAIKVIGWASYQGHSYEFAELLKTHDELVEAETSLPADDPMIAVLCMRLGQLFERCERFDEAEPLYKRAISAVEKQHDDVDGIVAVLDRLGLVSAKQRKFDQSETIYKRALELRLEQLGPNHPDVSMSYVNLANMYVDKHDHDTALIYLQRALPIATTHYGANGMEVAHIVEQLAISYVEVSDYTRAEPLFWQAYKIKKEHFDQQCPEIITLLTKLADMYTRDGKFAMAESVIVLFEHKEYTMM